jgi:hypothetical protein
MIRRLMPGLALAAATAGAQETLLPSAGGGAGISISAWHFAKAIPQGAGGLADVAEFSVPFRVRAQLGRWGFDLSGAGAAGAAHFTVASTGNGDEGGERATTLFGPTDVKLRLSGAVVSENWVATLGLTVPTGKVGLTGDETSTLQAIGAPALHMPVAALGTGAGATVGLIRAFQGDDWAFAVGGSFEQRTEYSPIAIALGNGKSETRVTPGSAIHATLGFDRTLGEHHWSGLLVADVFSKDQVKLLEDARATTSTSYQLGPQVTLSSQYEFGGGSWREASFNVAARMRSEFSDSLGTKVPGSSGNYLEASIGGVRGGTTGAGLLIGLDGRWHSGLNFTDALVGAAVTAVGATIGVERAGDAAITRFYIHGQYGSFDTGTIQTTGMGATIGFSIYGRREAR